MNNTKSLRKFRKCRTADMTLKYMENLVKAGVDVFDVDLGGYDSWWLPHPPNGMPPGVYLAVSEMVKRYFKERNILSNAGLPVPIIAVGKLGYPDLAEGALRESKCDMVMLARPLLADPYWPEKVYAGRVEEIIPCIGDHEGCLGQFACGGHIRCAVNPRTAFEDVYLKDLTPAAATKKIAVVGAGPAGSILACTAAKRGHTVTLFDRNTKAGGMLIPGSVPKIKYDMENYIEYINAELKRTSAKYQLKTVFDTTVTEAMLNASAFDAIVICEGSKALVPKIEGVEQPHVITGVDFLKNPSVAATASEIAVIGGADVGAEIAYLLSYELNKKVTIVELLPYFMKKSCTSNRGYLIHHLEKAGVRLLNCTSLKKINKTSIILEQNKSKTVPDPYITWKPILPDNISNPFEKKIEQQTTNIEIAADLVIMCTGAKPDDSLYLECARLHTAPELHCIGDSFSVGRVLEAVKSGYALGSTI